MTKLEILYLVTSWAIALYVAISYFNERERERREKNDAARRLFDYWQSLGR